MRYKGWSYTAAKQELLWAAVDFEKSMQYQARRNTRQAEDRTNAAMMRLGTATRRYMYLERRRE